MQKVKARTVAKAKRGLIKWTKRKDILHNDPVKQYKIAWNAGLSYRQLFNIEFARQMELNEKMCSPKTKAKLIAEGKNIKWLSKENAKIMLGLAGIKK